MIEIKDYYQKAKKLLGLDMASKDDNVKKAKELKTAFSTLMQEQAQLVINELSKMLTFVFG